MKHDARCLALVGVFLVATVVLGIRPYVPGWSNSLYGSNLGAYNMFVASVEATERVTLESSAGQELVVDHDQYFWMNRFISHTHARVKESTLARFAEFIAQRAEVIVDALKLIAWADAYYCAPGCDPWLSYRKVPELLDVDALKQLRAAGQPWDCLLYTSDAADE